MFSSAEGIIKFVREEKVEMIDFKVIDLVGRWYHVSIPASRLDESIFTEGIGIDASSYPGYKRVTSGDMKIVPDISTCIIDPFTELKTVSMLGDILESDGSPYPRYPRGVSKRAEAYLASAQRGTALFSPELEFYVFDDIRYASEVQQAFYQIDSIEGFWNTGKQESPNLGYKFHIRGGYHGIPPADTTFDLRAKMVKLAEEAGIKVRYHHHEVASGGQEEIELSHDTLLRSADAIMLMKYIIKNVARQSGKFVTFMPKPLYQEGGSGMHVHQYMSDGKVSLFYDRNGHAGLSQLALNYIAGLLNHGPALLGFTNPSTISYKRLVPGYETPEAFFYGPANRTAAVRIPTYALNERKARVEFRLPDATCNPYLALSAIAMAGIDGIENNIDPIAQGLGPFDVSFAEIADEKRAKIKPFPTSLEAALEALRNDCDFLLKEEVFTKDLIDAWIKYKLDNEVKPLRARPHPYEFELYSDI